jgi:hypothetical protein
MMLTKMIDYLQRIKGTFPALRVTSDSNRDKALYTCVCPVHGKFLVTSAVKLLQRTHGCLECSAATKIKNLTKWTTTKLVKHLRSVHGNTYGYTKVKYLGYGVPIILICKKHGPFNTKINTQTCVQPSGGIGQGCGKCWQERRSINVSIEALHECNESTHEGKYDLSLVKCISSWDQNLTIICPEHGQYKVRRADFMQGASCPFCYRDYKVVIGKRVFQVQGYERFALPLILKQNKLRSSQIYEGKHPDIKRRPPRIDYNYYGQWHSHYPDFWIPSLNTLIEIKSSYTAGLDAKDENAKEKRGLLRAKKYHAEKAGYKYVIFVVYRTNHKTTAKELIFGS